MAPVLRASVPSARASRTAGRRRACAGYRWAGCSACTATAVIAASDRPQPAGVVGDQQRRRRSAGMLSMPLTSTRNQLLVERAQRRQHDVLGQVGVEAELVDGVVAVEPAAQEGETGGRRLRSHCGVPISASPAGSSPAGSVESGCTVAPPSSCAGTAPDDGWGAARRTRRAAGSLALRPRCASLAPYVPVTATRLRRWPLRRPASTSDPTRSAVLVSRPMAGPPATHASTASAVVQRGW